MQGTIVPCLRNRGF